VPFKNHKRRGSQTNKLDFNSFVNVGNVRRTSRIASGRLFQVRRAAKANDLSPNDLFVLGAWSFPLTVDHYV